MKGNTLLLRQIHPKFVVCIPNSEGDIIEATHQAFTPFSGKVSLSFSDKDKITPEQAWRRYTQNLDSRGVMAITVSECREQGLKPKPDPTENEPDHVSVYFREGLSKRQKKSIGQILANLANKRGWLHGPV